MIMGMNGRFSPSDFLNISSRKLFLTDIRVLSNDTESSGRSDKGPQPAVLHRLEGILYLWPEVYGAVDEWRHVGLLSARFEYIFGLMLIGHVSRPVLREDRAFLYDNAGLLAVARLASRSQRFPRRSLWGKLVLGIDFFLFALANHTFL